ncbi:MAG TPA: prepilin-type N-terminal cleavage/methylation domain-containing protein [Actinomycetota bacterium]|nr:prepilin-type N-terminal cleavage/methylation domain-containing protein [Actinomycetota bacterium]
MGSQREGQEGFTLVETLVTMLMLSLASAAFYQVLFAGVEGSQTSRSVVRVSDEARLGLNRMIRDTRQANTIRLATPTGYAVDIDFDGNGTITPAPARNGQGDYEQLSFVVVAGKLYIEACSAAQGLDCGQDKTVLIDGVSAVPGLDIFRYSSNLLEYDCMPQPPGFDGVTDQAELNNTTCTVTQLTPAQQLSALTDIDYNLIVTFGDRSSVFSAHANIRNLR